MSNPIEYCIHEAKKSKSNFYFGFSFLPTAQRNAIMVIYAFCRAIDDAVDTSNDPLVAEKRIDWWKKELERAFADRAITPIGQALKQVVIDFNLSKSWFDEIILGIVMDLQHYSYQTFADLQVYCYRVAGIVGILVAKILGYEHKRTEDYARTLGITMQLINIIRDIGEDANRHRIYIPKDELEKFSISPNELLTKNIKSSENFLALMKFQAKRARKYYNDAIALLPHIDRPKQKSGLIMANIYLHLLDKIEKNNFNVLYQRNKLSTLNKLWITWKTTHTENQFQKELAQAD